MTNKKRTYNRYVKGVLEGVGVVECALIARAHGLQIVASVKPMFCAWALVTVYGTTAAVKRAEDEWLGRGAKKVSRHCPLEILRPVKGPFDRSGWAENSVDWANLAVENPLPPFVTVEANP